MECDEDLNTYVDVALRVMCGEP